MYIVNKLQNSCVVNCNYYGVKRGRESFFIEQIYRLKYVLDLSLHSGLKKSNRYQNILQTVSETKIEHPKWFAASTGFVNLI